MNTLHPQKLLFVALSFVAVTKVFAQNPKIRCYFNHPVNNNLSNGVNATYLKGTFPDTIVYYINNAKYTLDFAVYDFTSVANDQVSKIATAANNALKRGVKIRWINNGSSSNKGMSLLNTSIPRISSPKGSGYGIMHNKFLVVDVNSPDSNDACVITGSYNYSVEQTTSDYNNLLIIQNQQVATAFYNQFNQMWGGTDSVPNTTTSAFGTHKLASATHYFNVNGTLVDVHFSPKDSCGAYITKVANSANNDLTIGMYTFTDNTLAQVVLKKFNSKINVRCVLDVYSQTFSPYTTLSGPLGKDFIIYNGGANSLYHNKIMVVDALLPSSDPQVATGSFDWTSAGENTNDENMVIVHDSVIANQYYQSICNDITVNGGSACVSPLPVNWVSFDASITTNNQVALHWETAAEINTNHFEVERSLDGQHYERIGIVTDETSGKYQLIDQSPNEGINYYRIKEVDEDGNFTFSKVVDIYDRATAAVSIYPSPATNKVHVLLPLKTKSINLYDALGNKIAHYNVTTQSTIDVDVSHFARGGYYLEVVGDSNKVIRHFEKL